MENPVIHHLYESVTGTWQYIVADAETSCAVVIDPVLDFDPAKNIISTVSANKLLALINQMGYKVDMILETHAHADHPTAASYLQAMLSKRGSRPNICIGGRIKQVQKLFGERYGIPPGEYEDVFDKLWDDDEQFKIGNLNAQVFHLPGHTPDHIGYKIADNIFVGDSIFHVDIGSARADFPGGSAQDIYQSGRKILALPGQTKIWVGHDYPPDGRHGPVPCVSVDEQRQENKHLKDNITEQDFIAMRKERDEKLAEPKLLHQSLQINIRGGKLPKATKDGDRFLHLPLGISGGPW
ncbi:hypothetical protein NW752_007448 [Fusarium irregulare]|uniref:Metallo-beta-lactamase domain-containing protein n=1 Tax=Fusarium irregulare TaxID=2494466 RepID=A0A9W8PML5_9HYPO|nr:hypothetical protein NW766_007647 [Fusarium irregulare]KAJ4014677.1 hypothetical protein NW752_007448 [Fusarium irregulare]